MAAVAVGVSDLPPQNSRPGFFRRAIGSPFPPTPPKARNRNGLPKPIMQKLHDGLKKAYDDPQFKANAAKMQLELSYLNGEDFRKALKIMSDQIGQSVKK